MELPAPVGNELQRNPYRSAQRPREMCYRAIGCDNQVQTFYYCRSISKCIWSHVERISERFDPHPGRQIVQLFNTIVLLQADEAYTGSGGQPGKPGQWEGSSRIGRRTYI